jgi:biopolymer transport protein ExbD
MHAPTAATQPQDSKDDINLTPMLAVRANLERMRAEKPDSAVVIRADRRSMTDTLVQVMNASREAGIYDVMLAAQME